MGERLTAAEKQRNYRQRLKGRAAAAEAEAKQARGYSWPPFREANVAALTHGGESPRFRDPLAAAIAAELVGSGDCPAHLLTEDGSIRPRWRYAVAGWARQEAICALIGSWVAGLDLQAALAEQVTTDESSSYKGGRGSKRTVLTRLESAIASLDRAERRAQALRNDLLITPAAASRARLSVEPRADIMVLMQRRIEETDKEAGNG